ncbi:uncharacterized protein LOC127059984 [Serinus canaria]|uniref:uncharacterized protein LOC127059984 n=1 Tax=Serinus canaria TaxID=9135 RepID=UPI0021CC817A|nr:uncharacterized protein LOC127059984 [Serinus canaria]
MHSSQDCWGLQLLSHFGAPESVTQKQSWLKSTVPVLGFPAAVVVPVRLPTEVTELLILDRKQHCPLLLSRLILPQLPSLAEHGRLPGLCQRRSSSSAPSGGFPSEPEFIPLFRPGIHTCFVAGLREVFYRTCRPRRSLRGGILIKERKKDVLWKKGRGSLGPEFDRAYIWVGCVARSSWETQTHLSLIRTKSFSVFQDKLSRQMRFQTSLPASSPPEPPPAHPGVSCEVRKSRRAQPQISSAQSFYPKPAQKYVARFSKELNSLRALLNVCLQTQQWELQDAALEIWPRLGLLKKLAMNVSENAMKCPVL